ncbi:hypothetical protein DYB32_007459 [Aphanomyces invadans]|uniref:GAF domain-containing protein n=1 Tax=Aphanomyces invadans TaxID=157072 RepID=A0A3R6VI23_9STRA|nr:hypothetical protein DYB32_007459 [Aphanomyces invadans]
MARLPLKGSLEVKICMNCVLLDTEGPDNSVTMSMRENSTTASSRSSRSQDGHCYGQPSSPSASSHIAHDMDDDDAMMSMHPANNTLDHSWRYPWPKPPVLADEDERLDVLLGYDIIDSPSEEKYDIACTLAANSMKCPLAVVSFIDKERQWFKASVGLAQGEIPRNVSFCAHTIQSTQPLVVWNTMLDLRFVKNPLVTGNAAIRFYAGVPLVAPSGHVIGTIAVFDNQPRQSVDVAMLVKLSIVVMKYLEERRNTNAALAASKHVTEQTPVAAPVVPPSLPRRLSQVRRPSDVTSPLSTLPPAPVTSNTSQALMAAPAPVSTVAETAAPGANMEAILMNLLSKTTETQQQLATQQGRMFMTLGQHSEQIDKLADAVARMEAKLTTTSVI